MTQRYYVRAEWDPEANVFISVTNIPGLNVEARTLPEFVEIVEDLAPDLLEANVGPDARTDNFTVKALELAFG